MKLKRRPFCSNRYPELEHDPFSGKKCGTGQVEASALLTEDALKPGHYPELATFHSGEPTNTLVLRHTDNP